MIVCQQIVSNFGSVFVRTASYFFPPLSELPYDSCATFVIGCVVHPFTKSLLQHLPLLAPEKYTPMSNQSSKVIDLGSPIEKLFPPLLSYEVLYEGGFTWHIDNWKTLEDRVKATNNKKIESESFCIENSPDDGDFDWKLLLYPLGNNNPKCVAVYLNPTPKNKTSEEWSCCVQFSIFFSRPGQDDVHVGKVSYYRFSEVDTDWGFSDMIEIEKLKTRYKELKDTVPTGLLIDENNLNVTCYIRVIKDETGVTWHNFKNYDSKKVTNYIGFRNQGATCYLNSLLQTYFILNKFREMVYNIDTSYKTEPTENVDLALQRLFYNLQTSDTAVNTVELTKSFGWDSSDSFIQNDIQELNRLLLDKLEDSMDLKSLFVGEMKIYIKCLNVDYESSRLEDFWDIQLNVKNMSNIQESFDYYVQTEILEGDNAYSTDDYGLQQAKKGVIFTKLPNILFIQLNRFEYNYELDKLAKINDRYEFFESLDLSKYMEKSEGDEIYELHGVLVHSGGIDTGHYYAILKPKDEWLCFDDDRVWRVKSDEVFENNFGYQQKSESVLRMMGKPSLQKYLMRRQTNAYMLVYIKKDKTNEILKESGDDIVPQHVKSKLIKEKKAELEQQIILNELRTTFKLKVVDASRLGGYRGFDLFANPDTKLYHPDFNNEAHIQLVKVSREIDVAELKEMEAFKNKNIWLMGYSKSQALRIYKRIETGKLKYYINELLNCYIFTEDIFNLNNKDHYGSFLLFVKIFGEKEEDDQILPLQVNPFTKICDIYDQVIKKNPKAEPICYEEIGPNDVEMLKMDSLLIENELSNGDIISFGNDVLNIYKNIRFRIKLFFTVYDGELKHKDYLDLKRMDKYKKMNKTVSVWSNANDTYEVLAKNLGEKLGIEPKNLRICADYENKQIFLKSRTPLKQYLIKNYTFDTVPNFMFQILNVSLPSFENMRKIKVKLFTNNNYINYKMIEIPLLKSETVKHLRSILDKKFEEMSDFKEDKSEGTMTLWTNNSHFRFTGILTDDVFIDEIGNTEIVCARKLQIDESLKSIIVLQCSKTVNNTHGVSFVFQLKQRENFIDALDRLNSLFGLSKKEFSKIKLSSFSHKTSTTINISNMSNIDLQKIEPYDIYNSSDVLFFDHPDRLKAVYANRQMSIK